MFDKPERKVYKNAEFDAFVLWLSIPAFLKGKPRNVLGAYGFSDPILFDVMDIRTKTEFARRFKIRDLGTLTDWSKKIEREGLVKKEFGLMMHQQTMKVLLALGMRAAKTGEAKEVLAWMKIVEGWVYKEDDGMHLPGKEVYTLSPEDKANIDKLFKRKPRRGPGIGFVS